MTTTNLLIGKRKAQAALVPAHEADQFSETPLFGVGVNEEAQLAKGNEFLKAWPIGATLAGVFHGLKTMKLKDGEDEPTQYIRMESVDGIKFRAYAPGQLAYRAAQLEKGTYVEITYRGKEPVDLNGVTRNVHQFEVNIEKATH